MGFCGISFPPNIGTLPSFVTHTPYPVPELNVYEDEFRKHNINGKRLIKLTHGILKEDFGIKSFGHRDDLLEHIKRIQKSVEYPPLERSIEPLPPAADALERQLTLYIDVVAEHDPAVSQGPGR